MTADARSPLSQTGRTSSSLDLSATPRVTVRPVPHGLVTINAGFWSNRFRAVAQHGLSTQLAHCQSTGRLENFSRSATGKPFEFEGYRFNDSDVYKWLEAASYALAQHADDTLEQAVNAVVELVAAAQQADGYLNTYVSSGSTERYANLTDDHELYCMGHLIQAGIAHRRSLGSERLFNVALRAANHICTEFGPHDRTEPDGHPEIELALVELTRETGDQRYAEQALFFLDQRGATPPQLSGESVIQDHAPVRSQHEVVGHAVRQVYLAAAMVDVAMETDDTSLLAASAKLWESTYERKAYVTGGLGARYEGESFGADFELPNTRAYAETCAAVAGVMWNARLLAATGEVRHADWLERTLYNGALVGISIDGTKYFYSNPLAVDSAPQPGDDRGANSSVLQQTQTGHARQSWYPCACCPPNIARLITSIAGYAYGQSDNTVWIHQYLASQVTMPVSGSGALTLDVQTHYPWDGTVDVVVTSAPSREIELRLRIPGWACNARLHVNDKPVTVTPSSYVGIRRTWNPGTRLQLTLPMNVRLVEAHPRVQENRGRVALVRGPVVFCLESEDHPNIDLDAIGIARNTSFASTFDEDLLGGLTKLEATGVLLAPKTNHALYRTASPQTHRGPVRLTAIPYFAWANRTPRAMRVWLPLVTQ